MAGIGGGMGRLLGLGFVFGARDQGASRTAGAVADGLDRVADSAEETTRGVSAIRQLGQAIGNIGAVGVAQLDRIGDSLENLAERAGIDATDTGLESFGVEFSNTWRRATVGLGPLRDQVEGMRGEISGLAYSLDIDANDMISAVTGIARSGNSLDDFGISLRTVAGSIQSNILSGEQLASMLTGLSEGYELGAEGATGLVDRVTAIGEAFGMGADAVRRLPDVISAADPVLARFTNLSIGDVTESVTRLSVAMSRGLGVSFEQASQDAVELFNSLSEARAGMTDLVTGVGSDFPELAQELGIATGDVDEAMQAVLSDPVTFASRIRDLMGTMDRSSPAFARLQGALANLPANFRFLVTGGEEVGAALTEAMQPVENFEGAFNRMARSGAGTSRTFGESMQRLSDQFETRLHRMTSITTGEVLGRQRHAYERLGNYLQDWSGRGGALGFLTQGFLNVRRYGLVHGLLPMLEHRLHDAFPNLANQISTFAPLLSDMGEGFLSVAQSAGPMLVILGQLGVFARLRGAFSMLSGGVTAFLGPWGIAIAAITAGVGLIIYNWDTISNFFQTTDWSGMAHTAAQGFMQGLTALGEWGHELGDMIRGVDWVAVGQAIGDGIRTAFDFVASLFTGDFNGEIAQFFADAFEMPADEIVPSILDTLGKIFDDTIGQIPDIAHDILAGLFGEKVVDAVIESVASLPDRLLGEVNTVLGILLWPFEQLFGQDHISRLFHQGGVMAIFDDFAGYVTETFNVMGEVWDEVIAPMAEIAWEVTTEIGSAFADLWMDTIQPILDLFGTWWEDDFTQSQEDAQHQVMSTGEAFRRMWQRFIRPALFAFIHTQAEGINNFRRTWIPTLQRVAQFAIRSFFSITSSIHHLRSTFEGARDTLAAGWQLIGARVRRFFTQPILQAGDSFMTIFENIQMTISGLRLSFLHIVQSLVRGIQTAFNAIPAPLRSAMGIVGDTLDSAVGSIDAEVTREEQRVADARTEVERQRRERTESIASYDAEVVAAEAALAATVATNAARAARERAELAAEESRALAGVDTFAERVDESLGRAADRMADIGATSEDLSTAAPDLGVITTEPGAPVARTVTVDEGGGAAAPVVARTTEDETGSGTPTGHAAGTARERARARREAADAADEATSREHARDVAREMMISSFGTEAVRQLAQAFGRGATASRRARGSAAGGSGEEVGG